MLRMILLFAILALVAATFGFGWWDGGDGNPLAALCFWACGVVTLALIARAAFSGR